MKSEASSITNARIFFFKCGSGGGEVGAFNPVVQNPPANAGDIDLIPSPGRSTCHRAIKPVCHNY